MDTASLPKSKHKRPSKAERHRELWFRGNLRHMTRPGPQRQLYDRIHARSKKFIDFSPFTLNLHRRLGKSFLGALFCIEGGVKKPGIFAKFGAPTTTQAMDILEEHWGYILSCAPEKLLPKGWRGEKFTFRNPRWEGQDENIYLKSIVRLYGVNNDDGNKMRGGSTDILVLDECREMMNLNYTWGSVLLPTFKGRKEPLAILLSTPPESCDHPFVSRFIEEARDRKRYFCVPASEDPNWTEEEDEMMCREMGGRDTPTYQREIECKLISDSSRLIVPEFMEGDFEDQKGNYYTHKNWKRPEYYHAYSTGDMGAVDNTGVLFAFVDFPRKKLVVENELWTKDENSDDISKKWKAIEAQTFPVEEEKEAGRTIVGIQRWADTTVQHLVDLQRLYDNNVNRFVTRDKEADRNYLRFLFRAERISIDERCRELIFQLRNGTRTPKGQFVRTERMGHCDLIAALIQMAKVVNLEINPFPAPKVSRDSHFVPPTRLQKAAGWEGIFARENKRYRSMSPSWKRGTAWR